MGKTAGFTYSSVAIGLLAAGLVGCNKPGDAVVQAQNTAATSFADSGPAGGNLAPVSQTAPVETVQTAQSYSSPAYGDAYVPPVDTQDYSTDSEYDTSADLQPIEASEPPPPLPDYSQPDCPGDGYYWVPGYWGYTGGGYYWVPGTWVLAPFVGALWTPPYWDFGGGFYRWHAGYWGPHIGFYGGIDYGFGYTGRGYYGAYWNGGHLNYNRAVTNVNVTVVHNVYNYSVPNRRDRISYNGGRGGVTARPTPQEMAVARDPRTPPLSVQAQHARQASQNRAQFAGVSRQPAVTAAPRPLQTSYRTPAQRPPDAAMRAAQRPPAESRPENRVENRGNPSAPILNTPGRAPEANQPRGQAQNSPAGRPLPQQPTPAQVRPVPEQGGAPRPDQRINQRPEPQRPAQPGNNLQHNDGQRNDLQRNDRMGNDQPRMQQRPPSAPAARPTPEIQHPSQPAPVQRPALENRPQPQPNVQAQPDVRSAAIRNLGRIRRLSRARHRKFARPRNSAPSLKSVSSQHRVQRPKPIPHLRRRRRIPRHRRSRMSAAKSN